MDDLYRVCVKVYAAESTGVRDEEFIPIFHEWIRERALEVVLIDVADYTHAPDSPGVMLISHEASFALDRADGRFGLLVQRRRPIDGGIGEAIATTIRQAFDVTGRLEREPRLGGKLRFDAGAVRIEANDRLRAPNSDAGYEALAPRVRAAALTLRPDRDVSVTRIANDPRDRLAMELRIGGSVARPAADRSAGPFGGAAVCLLETRRISEMESLVLRHGGVPFAAPALSEVPTEVGPETTAAIECLASRGFDIVVLLTGVGTEWLLAAAARTGRGTEALEALARATTVVRGPKPNLALKKRGITPTILVPPPHDTARLLETLGTLQLAGRNVLVTSAGETMLEPAATLTAKGARVTELLLYRWDLSPDNEQALRRAVDEMVRGRIDAIAFTSQVQVRHLFDVAATVGQTEALRLALRDNVIVGAVGPTCADALRAHAITPDVIPDLSRMGHLVLALARAVEAKRARPLVGT